MFYYFLYTRQEYVADFIYVAGPALAMTLGDAA